MTRDIMGGLVFAVAAIVVYLACSVNPVTGDGNGNPTGPTCQNPSDAATLADFNVTSRNGTRAVDNSFESGPKRSARAKFKLKTPGRFTPMDLDLRFSNVKQIRVSFVPGVKGMGHRRTEAYTVSSRDNFSVPMDTAADPIIRMDVKAVPQNRKDVVSLQVDKFTACTTRAVPTTTASLPSETTVPTSLPLEPTTEPQSKLEYEGCFAAKHLTMGAYMKHHVSLEDCRKYCKSQDAKYLAMSGPYCDCVNVTNPLAKIDDGLCTWSCRGNSTNICGGRRKDSVYTTGDD